MADKKITKVEYFGMIKAIVEASDAENTADLLAFVDKQIELIESKAEKAKVRAAGKKAEGDELREVVASLLTAEYQTADAIAAQIEGEDVTKAKVVARLTQLCNAGVAVKLQDKIDSRKVMTYKLAEAE